jgi:endonuclease/exonuclease/phosphatase family metal-dependent hydrolase
MYSEDPNSIADFIASVNPDVVCLQELTNGYSQAYGDTGAYIANMLGYEYFRKYGTMLLPDGGQTEMGVGIMSRFPLRNTRYFQIERRQVEDGMVRSNDRYYVEAEVLLPKGNVVKVGTMHLPFHPEFITSPYVRQMSQDVTGHIPEEGNYILAADFNKPPQSETAKLFRQAGLKHAGPAFRYPTWTTKPFTIGQWSYDALRWRLDFILYKGNVTRHSSQILQTTLSDHLPILAEFTVRPATGRRA